MVQQYNEHPAAALKSVLPEMERIGAGLSGILGNDLHKYGYHLSRNRLVGTGLTGDYSLVGAEDTPVVDARAGCAIDIGMDWQAAGEWLEWVRAERQAGRLLQVAELIGDPDMIPGLPKDIKDACYTSAAHGWKWVNYTGQGHVTWCHVGIGRRYANDETFGKALLGGWSATGRVEEDDMYTEADRARDNNTNGRAVEVYAIKAALAASATREETTLALMTKLAELLSGKPGSIDMAQIKTWIAAEGEKSRAAQVERDKRIAGALDPTAAR